MFGLVRPLLLVTRRDAGILPVNVDDTLGAVFVGGSSTRA